LDYCNEQGIPHSRFLEEWDPVDRAKCLAYRAHHAQHCPTCGTAAWEWDPAQGGSRFAYEPVEEICPGCQIKEYLTKEGKSHPGKFVRLRPKADDG
jgi:hypothetical protein